jgi:hypothetical protein
MPRVGSSPWLVLALLAGCSKSARPDATAGSATVAHPKSDQASPAFVTFDELSYPPPAGFTLKDDTSEDIPSRIPGAAPDKEQFRGYVDAAGHGLYLFSFRGLGHERGPMKAEESWEMKIGGRGARLSRASMFFGAKQDVLTAHFEGPSGANYLVYTNRLDRSAFEAFLRTLSFH